MTIKRSPWSDPRTGGNRNWCRWLCPYGQTFGLLNKVGFCKIEADKQKCISCGKCTKECDMGIPVQHLVETKGEVNVPDCVGCGRCITTCPTKVLSFCDVRSLFKRTPLSIESRGLEDIGPRGKGINVNSVESYVDDGGRLSIIETSIDHLRNRSVEANQSTCTLLDQNPEEDHEIERKRAC